MATKTQFEKLSKQFNQSLFVLDMNPDDRTPLSYSRAKELGKVESLTNAYQTVLHYRERFDDMDRTLLACYIMQGTIEPWGDFDDIEEHLTPELIQYRQGFRKRLLSALDYEQRLAGQFQNSNQKHVKTR